jgi:Clr5 domain
MSSGPKQKMKRSRRSETSYSTEEWNVKRDLITRLYFEEDKTLKEVRQLLEREYNFQPT